MSNHSHHTATQAKKAMAGLSRDEVRHKMRETSNFPEYQEEGLARLSEIDREESESRHQESRAMHAESMAQATKLHDEIKNVEKWGRRIALAALLASVLFPSLELCGCSWQFGSKSPPLVPQEEKSYARPSDASKNKEHLSESPPESKAPPHPPLVETAKEAEEPAPKVQ